MAAIALDAVTKAYADGEAAVRDVTLEVADGELLVLVGPSGCGKSTVLRLVAGLEMPTTGRVLIDGQDATRVAPQHRDLAMVFQNYALYPHMTVRENLGFALRVRSVPAAETEARVRAAAAMLGLDAVLDRKPTQLSGGQRQRVALGRAVVREPKAFLLDEPLSNLDPVLRVSTRAELTLLHRRLAITVLYVTHDQEEAMTLGTRVAVMRGGTIEQVGASLEVFERPATAFVAGFVGSPAMNLWPCSRRRNDTGARLVAEAITIDVDGSEHDGLDRADLLAGVRPHDVDLVSPAEGDVVGTIDIIERLGHQTILHLRVDGLPDDRFRAVVPPERAVRLDEVAGLRVRRDRLHLFDRTTGIRLQGQLESH
jgi:multiple sugar transport system ATP-binding protein